MDLDLEAKRREVGDDRGDVARECGELLGATRRDGGLMRDTWRSQRCSSEGRAWWLAWARSWSGIAFAIVRDPRGVGSLRQLGWAVGESA